MSKILVIYNDPDIEYDPLCTELVDYDHKTPLDNFLYNWARSRQVVLVEAYTISAIHTIHQDSHLGKFGTSSVYLP
jgi:hypothetical protein